MCFKTRVWVHHNNGFNIQTMYLGDDIFRYDIYLRSRITLHTVGPQVGSSRTIQLLTIGGGRGEGTSRYEG